MEKSTNTEGNGKVVEPQLTKDHVLQWCTRDIAAAGYFLNMLKKYPDVIEMIATELYEKAQQERRDSELLKKESNAG